MPSEILETKEPVYIGGVVVGWNKIEFIPRPQGEIEADALEVCTEHAQTMCKLLAEIEVHVPKLPGGQQNSAMFGSLSNCMKRLDQLLDEYG